MKRFRHIASILLVLTALTVISVALAAGKAPVLTAKNDESTGKIVLTWTAVDGADQYEVYRATSKNGTYSKISTTTKLKLTNTGAVAGRTYYYKVRAVDGKVKGAFSAIVSRTCDLAQPKVKASNVENSGKIKLTWDKVDGAVKYEVYRATSKNGTYKLIKTTTATIFANTSTTAGTSYYYKVKAIAEKSSANSAYSEIVSRTCDLARPVVAIGKNSSGQNVLSWDAVTGADKYKVYRCAKENGTYSEVSVTTKLKMTIDASGSDYYYKVQAISGKKSAANSALSEAVRFETPPTYAIVTYAQWINTAGNSGYCLATLQYMDGSTQSLRVKSVNGNTCRYYVGKGDFFKGQVSTTLQYNSECNLRLCEVVANDDGTVALNAYPESQNIVHYDNVTVKRGVAKITGTNCYADNNTLFFIYDANTYAYKFIMGYQNLDATYDGYSADIVMGKGIFAQCVYLVRP